MHMYQRDARIVIASLERRHEGLSLLSDLSQDDNALLQSRPSPFFAITYFFPFISFSTTTAPSTLTILMRAELRRASIFVIITTLQSKPNNLLGFEYCQTTGHHMIWGGISSHDDLLAGACMVPRRFKRSLMRQWVGSGSSWQTYPSAYIRVVARLSKMRLRHPSSLKQKGPHQCAGLFA